MNSPSDDSSWELTRTPAHCRSTSTVLAQVGYNAGQIAESSVTDEPPDSFRIRIRQLSGEL